MRATACAPAEPLVRRFIAAPGDAADDLIAPEPAFEWYSARDRVGDAASDRSSLATYLAGRRQQATQRLVEFQDNGVDGAHRNFSFVIDETARDTTTVRFPGKGASICSGLIVVRSEGASDPAPTS